jgi:hypothetical protein
MTGQLGFVSQGGGSKEISMVDLRDQKGEFHIMCAWVLLILVSALESREIYVQNKREAKRAPYRVTICHPSKMLNVLVDDPDPSRIRILKLVQLRILVPVLPHSQDLEDDTIHHIPDHSPCT